ncbi:MAG: flavin reductase [Prevotellaceae bacterium]|jgi:flavin reductase (DIM6/NTAB) family NADH-FMN oxidoreductase RutF|nr:flavin reductase [Prevotellaceae bacterium]
MRKFIPIIALAALAGCGGAKNEQTAMKNYRVTPIEQVQNSAPRLIGQGWMLITAGNLSSYNTMTASWGQLGHLWNKNVATMYIRPQRYTKEFVDREGTFTLSFFKENYRNALNICGTKSGRDGDKVKEAGLTPIATPAGSVGFEEAYMIIECRKLYADPLKAEAFVDSSIPAKIYPEQDFHTFYVGEILNVYVK